MVGRRSAGPASAIARAAACSVTGALSAHRRRAQPVVAGGDQRGTIAPLERRALKGRARRMPAVGDATRLDRRHRLLDPLDPTRT